MSSLDLLVLHLIGVVLGSTLFGSANVDLVTLEASNLGVDPGKNPGSRTDTSSFQPQTKSEEDKDNWVGKEGNREGRSHKLPRDGSKDGSKNGSKKTSVEERLETIRDSKDVLAGTDFDVHRCYTSGNEPTQGHADLTTNHESRKVNTFSSEEKFASLHGELVLSLFFLGELGDGKEGNLHTLEQTDTTGKDNKDNDGGASGNTGPHGSLAFEESSEGNGTSISKDTTGHEASCPEEKVGSAITDFFVSLNGLSGEPRNEKLNDVGSVKETGEFNHHGNVESEDSKVVVDKVKHHVSGVDLSSELTNHGTHQNHGDSRVQKDLGNKRRESKDRSSGKRSTRVVDDEDKQHNHELTTHEVTIKVVTLVGDLGALVSDGVGIFVEININRRKTDQRTLSTFHHSEPNHGYPNGDKCSSWVEIGGDTSLSTEDETHDNRNGEDQETCRVLCTERRRRTTTIGVRIARHLF